MAHSSESQRDDSFFDKDIETMSPERLYESRILPSIKVQIAYVLKQSPFYRKKFRRQTAAGIAESFSEIPFTEKSEILSDQNLFPPFGSNLCAAPDQIQRVHRTSGTTARPIFIALTRRDVETTVSVGARCFWSSGLRPGDRVIHCLNYCLWMGGYTDHQSLEATGATVVPYGVGNTANLIQTILDMGVDTIHCTPSYLTRIEEVLRTEYNLAPRDLGLKKALFGGESGIQNPNVRNAIEQKWGILAMNANYGLSDVLSMFGAECSFQQGLHFLGQNAVLPEIIDSNGTVLPVRAGVRGELVLTNLRKEALPLIRFRTHDIIEILGTRCKCHRTGFRFRVLGRSDDMLVVKGINVFPQAIGDIIHDYLETMTGEYQVVTPKTEPLEKIFIRAEIRKGISKKQAREIQFALGEKLKRRLNIRPGLEFVKEGELPRTSGKNRRLVRL